MREGIVLYNNEGAPIWACANVDARAAREVSELKELHNNTFENEVYRATGQTLALSAIPRLLWLAHHRSDIYRQASTITMISDWLAYMLSGELAVDPSNAGTTGLLDLTTRDWKPALLDMAGLRADILSPVKETGTLLGVVSSQAAELCGLKAGTPVVVGGGDVQLGCLGLGVVRPAQTAVLGGTFWQQVVNLAAPVTDPEMNVRVNPHVIPGMVQAESISFFTGLTMRWFRDAFCQEEMRERKLVRVLPDWAPAPAIVHAVFPSRRGLSPAVRRFLDYLGEAMPGRSSLSTRHALQGLDGANI